MWPALLVRATLRKIGIGETTSVSDQVRETVPDLRQYVEELRSEERYCNDTGHGDQRKNECIFRQALTARRRPPA